MFHNTLSKFRKRRRIEDNDNTDNTDNTLQNLFDTGKVSGYAEGSTSTNNTAGGSSTGSNVANRTICATTNASRLEIDGIVTKVDQLDARVEQFRKDALDLQQKRDVLLMSIDIIKSNSVLDNMKESESDEVVCYIERVNSRLSTVELDVRDTSQEDSLKQVNALIDVIITMGDPVMARQRCQQYL